MRGLRQELSDLSGVLLDVELGRSPLRCKRFSETLLQLLFGRPSELLKLPLCFLLRELALQAPPLGLKALCSGLGRGVARASS